MPFYTFWINILVFETKKWYFYLYGTSAQNKATYFPYSDEIKITSEHQQIQFNY